jgi:hypothetical protein
MRTFLTYSFYLCGVGFLLYEILKIQGLSLFESLNNYAEKAKEEQEKNAELEASGKMSEIKIEAQISYSIIALLFAGWSIAYAVWTLIGLFSSQWVLFLAILILSIVVGAIAKVFKNRLSLIMRVDAIITVIILVFMFINRFHLHLI